MKWFESDHNTTANTAKRVRPFVVYDYRIPQGTAA